MQKTSGFKILALTDSGLHSPYESLYPNLRQLSAHPDIDSLHIADRHDDHNRHFYRDRLKVNGLHVFEVDDAYSYETRHDYSGDMMPLADFDAVWLLLDHPVAEEFLRHIASAFKDKFVMNDPLNLIKTSSKGFLLELKDNLPGVQRFLPPMALCSSAQEVEAFKKDYPDIVLKTLRGYGGTGVLRYKQGETDLKTSQDVQAFLDKEGGACLAMQYMDFPQASDKRSIVFNGEVIGSLLRKPSAEGWLCNVASGGTCEEAEANPDELALIALLSPYMHDLGVYMYGIDMLKNAEGQRMLSEINTLNIGGVLLLEQLNGKPLSKLCADLFAGLVKDFYDGDKAGKTTVLNIAQL